MHLARLAVPVLFALLLGVLAVRRAAVTDNSDFDGFHRSGAAVLAGEDPTSDKAVRRYLPCFPLMMAPLGALPLPVAAAMWYVLGAASCWGTWRELGRLLGSGRGRALALTAGLTAPFWIDGLVMGQVNPLLVWAMTRALRCLAEGKDAAAGALLGFASALKVTPALLVVYAAWRLRGRAVGAAAAVFLLLAALAPAAAWGPARTLEMYRSWVDEALVGGVAGGDAESGRSVRYNNQSVQAWCARLLTDVDAGTRKGRFSVNLAALDPATARGTARAILAGLVLALLAAWGRPGRAPARGTRSEAPVAAAGEPPAGGDRSPLPALPTGPDAADPERKIASAPEASRLAAERALTAEGALAVAGTVLLSPIAWTSHFQALAPAVALLARRALAPGPGCTAARVALAILAATLLGMASPWSRAVGCPLVGAVAAWLVAAALHRRGLLDGRSA